MISEWIREAQHIVRETIGCIASGTMEYHLLIALALIAFLFAMFNVSSAMGSRMATPLRVFTASAAALLLVMAAAIATRLYIIPSLHSSPMTAHLPLIIAGLVLLVCAAPLAKWILAAGYFEAVFALVLSVAAAALVVVMTHAAFNAFHEGDREFEKTHERRDSINRIIDNT